jgi:hypothetical protein
MSNRLPNLNSCLYPLSLRAPAKVAISLSGRSNAPSSEEDHEGAMSVCAAGLPRILPKALS